MDSNVDLADGSRPAEENCDVSQLARLLKEGEADVAAGRVRSAPEFFAELRWRDAGEA